MDALCNERKRVPLTSLIDRYFQVNVANMAIVIFNTLVKKRSDAQHQLL